MCLFAMCTSSLMMYLFRSFAHCNGLLLFSLLSFENSENILSAYQSFIEWVFSKYFLPVCGLSFQSLHNVT